MKFAFMLMTLFVIACGADGADDHDMSACYKQRSDSVCPFRGTDQGAGGAAWYWIVCGDNGVTYQYWEEANCSCFPYHSGACDPESCSTGDPGPAVCGTDGKTYAGDQTAGCHGALRAHEGPCDPPDGG